MFIISTIAMLLPGEEGGGGHAGCGWSCGGLNCCRTGILTAAGVDLVGSVGAGPSPGSNGQDSVLCFNCGPPLVSILSPRTTQQRAPAMRASREELCLKTWCSRSATGTATEVPLHWGLAARDFQDGQSRRGHDGSVELRCPAVRAGSREPHSHDLGAHESALSSTSVSRPKMSRRTNSALLGRSCRRQHINPHHIRKGIGRAHMPATCLDQPRQLPPMRCHSR